MTRLRTMPYRIEAPAQGHRVLTAPRPRRWLGPFLVGFVGMVALGFVAMELMGLRYVQAYTCPEMLKVRFFQTNVADPAVVYLGNSQMHYGVMPPIVADAAYGEQPLEGYNLALPGVPLDLSHILVRDLLQGRRKPRVLVLGVMPLDLESNGRNEPELLFRYGSLNDIFAGVESGMLPPTALASGAFRGVETLTQAPFQRLKKPIRAYRREHLQESRGGWWTVADIDLAFAIPAANWEVMVSKLGQPQSLSFEEGSHSVKHLLAIRDLAQKRGIQLVLVLPPQHPDCLKRFYTPDSEPRFRAWMDSFCQKERLPYWDLNETAVYAYGDFADPIHLNARGAAKFSRRLAERLAGLLHGDASLVNSNQRATPADQSAAHVQ